MIFADAFTFYFLIAPDYIEMSTVGLFTVSQVAELTPDF